MKPANVNPAAQPWAREVNQKLRGVKSPRVVQSTTAKNVSTNPANGSINSGSLSPDLLASVAPTRQTTLINASSGTSTGAVPLALGWRLIQVSATAPARFRMYVTAAQRDADLARPATEDPDPATNPGLLLEVTFAAGILDIDLAPLAEGVSPESNSAPWSITGAEDAMSVSLTWIKTEG